MGCGGGSDGGDSIGRMTSYSEGGGGGGDREG